MALNVLNLRKSPAQVSLSAYACSDRDLVPKASSMIKTCPLKLLILVCNNFRHRTCHTMSHSHIGSTFDTLNLIEVWIFYLSISYFGSSREKWFISLIHTHTQSTSHLPIMVGVNIKGQVINQITSKHRCF